MLFIPASSSILMDMEGLWGAESPLREQLCSCWMSGLGGSISMSNSGFLSARRWSSKKLLNSSLEKSSICSEKCCKTKSPTKQSSHQTAFNQKIMSIESHTRIYKCRPALGSMSRTISHMQSLGSMHQGTSVCFSFSTTLVQLADSESLLVCRIRTALLKSLGTQSGTLAVVFQITPVFHITSQTSSHSLSLHSSSSQTSYA